MNDTAWRRIRPPARVQDRLTIVWKLRSDEPHRWILIAECDNRENEAGSQTQDKRRQTERPRQIAVPGRKSFVDRLSPRRRLPNSRLDFPALPRIRVDEAARGIPAKCAWANDLAKT